MDTNITYRGLSQGTISFSGTELAGYLRRMLPDISVSINNQSGHADLTINLQVVENCLGHHTEKDCFHIHIEESTGSITGNSERSVLLGVYDYLHKLGCRFLAPGKEKEFVPVISASQLYMNYQKEASLMHRGVCIEGADSLENILDFVDWLPKVGYNSFFLQFKVPYTFLARWYQHEKNPYCKPEAFTMDDAVAYMDIIEKAIKQRSLLLHKAGHGWTGEALGLPSLEWKENHITLNHDQEQMAAMIGGQRRLFGSVPTNTNLCYSNQMSVKAFTDLVVNYAGSNPQINYLHLWLADEYNNVCECDECQKTTLSDQYVALLNQVDQALTQKGLETKLVFLLYQELLWPPVRERLQNPERFVLMFAPISRTFEESYQIDTKNNEIPPYIRNQITLPVDLTENLAFLRGWQKQFQGDSFIYDYPLGRAHYGDFGYVHIARIISEDIKKLDQMGLNGYISCQELRVTFPNALPNYIMGYMLFDTSSDTDELIEEYFQAAYGADAPTVLTYLTELSILSSCDYFNGIGDRFNPHVTHNLEEMSLIAANFAHILEKHCSANGIWDTFFWKVLDYHRQYVLRLIKALHALSKGELQEASEGWCSFRQFICEHEPEFQECLDVYRVLEVSGKYTRFPQPDSGIQD